MVLAEPTMKLLTANDLGKMHRCQAQTIRKRARLRGITPAQSVGGNLVWWDSQARLFAPGPNGWYMQAGRKAKPRGKR